MATAVAREITIARIAVLKAYGAKALTIPDGPSLGVSQIGMPRNRYLALMAREAMNRRGAELSMPADGARLWIWSDLHFDDERIRRHAKRPFPTICTMNWAPRDRWREAVALGDTVVCAGDLGGRRNIFGRWKPPCENLPGRKVVVLGNYDFTRFRWRERRLGADASVRKTGSATRAAAGAPATGPSPPRRPAK